MLNRERIENMGWSVLFMRNQVSIEHPEYGRHRVCGKYVGGWDYEDELGLAVTWIHERRYEETESYQKREENGMSDTNPFIKFLGEQHEKSNASVSDDTKAFIDALSDEEIERIMGVEKSVDKFRAARDGKRYKRCENMLSIRTDKLST